MIISRRSDLCRDFCDSSINQPSLKKILADICCYIDCISTPLRSPVLASPLEPSNSNSPSPESSKDPPRRPSAKTDSIRVPTPKPQRLFHQRVPQASGPAESYSSDCRALKREVHHTKLSYLPYEAMDEKRVSKISAFAPPQRRKTPARGTGREETRVEESERGREGKKSGRKKSAKREKFGKNLRQTLKNF